MMTTFRIAKNREKTENQRTGSERQEWNKQRGDTDQESRQSIHGLFKWVDIQGRDQTDEYSYIAYNGFFESLPSYYTHVEKTKGQR